MSDTNSTEGASPIKTRIKAFTVQDNGFFDPIPFKQDFLRTKNQSDQVFILVDEERKELWIWIGGQADVRTRFISSTVAQEIRGHYGKFHVRSADQGSEPEDFWKCLDSVPKEGIGPVSDITSTEEADSMKSSESTKLIPPKSPVREMLKIDKLKQIKVPLLKKSEKKSIKTKKEPAKVPTDYSETNPSLTNITTPLCPHCRTGHLLPFSNVVDITSRRKEVLPFAKWVCSNCGFSPKGIDS